MLGFKKLFNKTSANNEICAFLEGTLIPIEDVNDETFSSKLLGEGLAIEPTNNTLISPADGTVSVIMEDSFHACGIMLDCGIEILLHIGIDTVSMKGDGFTPHIKAGDKVKKGDSLITFDLAKIKNAGFYATTMMVVTANDDNKTLEFSPSGKVCADDVILIVK